MGSNVELLREKWTERIASYSEGATNAGLQTIAHTMRCMRNELVEAIEADREEGIEAVVDDEGCAWLMDDPIKGISRPVEPGRHTLIKTGGERDEPRYPGESDEAVAFRRGVEYGERDDRIRARAYRNGQRDVLEGAVPVEVEARGGPIGVVYEKHDDGRSCNIAPGSYWLVERNRDGDTDE